LFTLMIIFHVLVSLGLIVVVLMQSAKGEGLAGGTAFGGSISGAVFGGRGAASFLSKATTVLAVVFMINCGVLAFMSSTNRVATNPADVTESTVTRKMAEEQDKYMKQQQAAQAAKQQDSLAQIIGQPGEAAPAVNDSAGK